MSKTTLSALEASAEVATFVDRVALAPHDVTSKFDNRDTWDNKGKSFDNRSTWDNGTRASRRTERVHGDSRKPRRARTAAQRR
ncbi:multiple cyclophane-containing RiPP AmcA [Marinitenerispora sediminis]|uniref:Uncharacterized protein n=1 Tax=Marinitenerispora sediminis TaxID=1931232 RepID=A0A368T4U9_9ACTN|nr:multiple cyclophane-containing RiPP AmcA [Marinitenerispora sediminis]RCV52545.1 hypothetical protein DEF28_12740 [Marinitenerispora sediminis]RCV53775.1 hypothetical protein DEF24_20110 [Marinitenerispora sediminis]RCV59611.1 hypothetical protein DEF23_06970 [Marinitenerispora sediminis]